MTVTARAKRASLGCGLAALLFIAVAPRALRAQAAGPMQPPESTKFPAPPPAAKPEPPPVSPDEIIRRFAAREDDMVRAIRGYTFQRDVRLQEIGPDNKPAGQMEVTSQLRFAPDGKLFEKQLSRPPSTLRFLNLERGDSAELVAPAPFFPLTTAILPKYEITYGGKQPLDELTAYYFTIKPRALERSRAYFSGVVWVDEQDFVIVKMMGKWVTETGDVTAAGLPFTVFETYRQQVGKNLWFPAYARSDDTAEVGNANVPVRITVKWSDYTQAPLPAESPAPAAASPPSGPKP